MRHNPVSMTKLRDTSALALGSVSSGLLAYVFFALVTRALGATAAAPVSVLWAYWSFAGAALTFPFQHWIARSVVAHGEGSVREALRGVALLSAGTAVVATGLAWALRDLLFHTDRTGEAWFPLLVGAVTLGAAATGVVRGMLSARRRFAAVGAGLVAENGARCLAAVVLAAAGVDSPEAYGLCLVLGYVAAVAWPSTFRLSSARTATHAAPPWAFLGGASGGQLIGQTVLTGGPVALALAGGSAAQVTALFAGLALFRAPYTLALGLVSQLTGRLTHLVVEGRRQDLRRVGRWLVVATLLAAAGAALVGASAGPPLLRLVFGSDVTLPGRLTLVLAVGSTFAIANLVVTLVVLALDRTLALVRSWAVALLPGAVWFVASGSPALERTCVTFLVVESAALALLLVEQSRGTRDLTA
ncbi:MAG: hypothetical protein JWN22_3507 [Nocardioides sp.]|nr:hypothetical protein [Nocardioides sp.]